jgi:hypothetical protein
MELCLSKLPSGALAPVRDEDVEQLQKVRSGATLRCKVTQMRNGRFFRKWWVLAKYAYDLWSENVPTIEHRGQRVQPDFERFRKDLIILAGHYHPVFNIRGEMRVEADSLRWDRMDEQTFERLYSQTINAILTRVLARDDLTEQQLREHVDRVLSFD